MIQYLTIQNKKLPWERIVIFMEVVSLEDYICNETILVAAP